MSYREFLIVAIVSAFIFWVMNNAENYNSEYYSCPEHCSVEHEHMGVKGFDCGYGSKEPPQDGSSTLPTSTNQRRKNE